MNKRFLIFILLVAALAILLAACSSGGGDPAKTVEQYLQAKVEGDEKVIRQLLCSEKEADAFQEINEFEQIITPEMLQVIINIIAAISENKGEYISQTEILQVRDKGKVSRGTGRIFRSEQECWGEVEANNKAQATLDSKRERQLFPKNWTASRPDAPNDFHHRFHQDFV